MFGGEFRQTRQASFKSSGKDPPFAVSALAAESAYVIDDSESAHFGADGFESPRADFVFLGDRFECGQELILRPLEFHEDGEERDLVIPVSRKQDAREVVQPFHAGDLVAV